MSDILFHDNLGYAEVDLFMTVVCDKKKKNWSLIRIIIRSLLFIKITEFKLETSGFLHVLRLNQLHPPVSAIMLCGGRHLNYNSVYETRRHPGNGLS